MNSAANKQTGYPSIDKPWLKYYSEEAINAPVPEMSICEWIKEQNNGKENDIAFRYLNYSLSFKNLFRQIDIASCAFAGIGVKKGDIVTVALPNIPENVITIYALNRIGAIANLIDLRCQGDDLVRHYNEVNSTVAVVCDMFLKNTLSIKSRVNLEHIIVASPYDHLPLLFSFFLKRKYNILSKETSDIEKWKTFITNTVKNKVPAVKMNANDTACILHTSGTTGESKGVMLSNHCFNAMSIQYKYGYGYFQPGDSFLNQVPPFLAYSAILAIHIPLSLHLKMIMLPEYRPDKFAENMIKYKANHVAAGPADWANFLNNNSVKKHDLSFIYTLGSGGDAMRIDAKRAVNELIAEHGCKSRIMEGYGTTEVGSAACTNLRQCDVEGSVGIPLPKMTFCIWDVNRQCELPYREKGEICISGPTVMNGYYNKKEETNAVLRDHGNGIFWLHTGDMGYIDENGCVFLDGRMKRIIIQFNGMKINPYEIEKVLLKEEMVKECCVVGANDTKHGTGAVPIAFIVADPSNELKPKELEKRITELCQKELVERYRPAEFRFIDQLPLTPNGKIDYRTLEKTANEPS